MKLETDIIHCQKLNLFDGNGGLNELFCKTPVQCWSNSGYSPDTATSKLLSCGIH